MKKITALTCLAAALFLNLSCEKHTWEDTKMFNQNRKVGEHHGEHGAGPAEGHAPAAAGEHAPAEKH